MKRSIPLSVLVLIIFVAAACGSPASTATNAPAQPAATEAALTQPGSVETAPAGTGTQVDITLADNTIDASQTEFQVGVPYTL